MGEFVFTVAKGRAAELARRGTIGVLLLKRAEPDDILQGYRTVADLLTANDEANFTGYERHTGIPGEVLTDDQGQFVRIPSQEWAKAGGEVNNRIRKLVVFHDDDGVWTPLTGHDADAVTDGNTLRVDFAEGAFFAAV